jgi:hypothetical protein
MSTMTPTLAPTAEHKKMISVIQQWVAGKPYVYTEQVWTDAMGKPKALYSAPNAQKIAIILASYCGWTKSGARTRIDGQPRYLWFPPVNSARGFADLID